MAIRPKRQRNVLGGSLGDAVVIDAFLFDRDEKKMYPTHKCKDPTMHRALISVKRNR